MIRRRSDPVNDPGVSVPAKLLRGVRAGAWETRVFPNSSGSEDEDMGEAKRRKSQGQAFAARLAERLAGGEFGPPAAARRYCIVLDKSPVGTGALAALRETPVLDGLAELLATDALRFWQASPLFAYALLCGGSGSAERRCLLAADLDKLLARSLPQAMRLFGAERPGLVPAVDAAAAAALAGAAAR